MDKTEKKGKETLEGLAIFLMWFGLIGIFLWAIAKSLGWIHSPEWVDMVPYLFGSMGGAGFFVYCGKVLNRLERVEKDIEQVDDKIDEIVQDTSVIKVEIKAQGIKIESLERNVFNPSK